MSQGPTTDAPLGKRLYDRIWLLAAAAILYFLVVYVVWGVMDVFAVPAG